MTVQAAMDRAALEWTPEMSHVDCEQAFLDRTLLYGETARLGAVLLILEEKLNAALAEAAEAEREMGVLARELDTADREIRYLQDQLEGR